MSSLPSSSIAFFIDFAYVQPLCQICSLCLVRCPSNPKRAPQASPIHPGALPDLQPLFGSAQLVRPCELPKPPSHPPVGPLGPLGGLWATPRRARATPGVPQGHGICSLSLPDLQPLFGALSPQGPPRDPKDPPRRPRDPPRTPEGSPRAPQGTPRTPQGPPQAPQRPQGLPQDYPRTPLDSKEPPNPAHGTSCRQTQNPQTLGHQSLRGSAGCAKR